MAKTPQGAFVGQSPALLDAYKLAERRGLGGTLFRSAREALPVLSVVHPEFLVADYVLPDCDAFDLYNRLALLEVAVPTLVIAPSEGSWLELIASQEDRLTVVPANSLRPQAERFLTDLGFRKKRRTVSVGSLELDLGQRYLGCKGKRVRLTPKQAAVMGALVGRIGELVRREELTYALDMAGRRMERSVDHHVRLLRRLLGDLGCQELTIDAVYGLGYRLRFRSEEVGHG